MARIAALELDPTVVVRPGTVRPIRIRIGTLTFMFKEAEALELANKIVDATEELRPSLYNLYQQEENQP